MEEKLNKLKEDGAEEVLINKQNQLIAETAQMLPNCKNKIESAIEELKNLMSEHEEEEELKQGEEWKVAEMTLAEACAFIETI